MKLYVARHTESNYNVKMLLNADPSVDVHLTDKGIEQAKELARALADIKFEVIFISELPRTKQTADIINQQHRVPVIVDGRLNDNVTGYEGKPIQDFMKAFNSSTDKWREIFKDGESLEQARARVNQFLKDLKETNYSSVLIITHGYVIECVYGILHGLSYEESSKFRLPQGEFAVFEY